jgi:hypothetical protein
VPLTCLQKPLEEQILTHGDDACHGDDRDVDGHGKTCEIDAQYAW